MKRHRLQTHAAWSFLPTCLKVLSIACCFCLILIGTTFAQIPNKDESKLRPPTPQPALSAVIHAFDQYEVVGMSEAHDMQDVDNFILDLIREPAFALKVNDVVVECGNSLYQPILDRYLAGDQVSFTDVQKVWRNTTQPMCGESAFFEQLFPLIRSINLHLPADHRLRVLAADPPIDWSKVASAKDVAPFMNRDVSIASVMETEVLSRHRRALMLFGIFHLLHGAAPDGGNAVTIYEKTYPGRTFVISDFGYYGDDPKSAASLGTLNWPSRSLLLTKGNWLGALSLGDFLPTPITTDNDCNVVDEFASGPKHDVSSLIDAFLYLGPQNLRLKEKLPADIALDTAYQTEWQRRNSLMGLPGASTLEQMNQQTVAGAGDPVLSIPRQPDAKQFYPFIKQNCMERRAQH